MNAFLKELEKNPGRRSRFLDEVSEKLRGAIVLLEECLEVLKLFVEDVDEDNEGATALAQLSIDGTRSDTRYEIIAIQSDSELKRILKEDVENFLAEYRRAKGSVNVPED
jgi:hypothetical protein